jgi:hypothetical protein
MLLKTKEGTVDSDKDSTKGLADEDVTSIKKRIQTSLGVKNSVSLTDILMYSLDRVIELIPNPKKIVEIDLDISGILRQACILDGIIYGIPTTKDFNWSQYMGDDSDLFISCDNEAYKSIRKER